jgi:hypothetical protein
VLVRKERVSATLAEVVGAFREGDRNLKMPVHKCSEGGVDRRLGARLIARRLPVDQIVLVERGLCFGEVHDGRYVGVELDRLCALSVRVR